MSSPGGAASSGDGSNTQRTDAGQQRRLHLSTAASAPRRRHRRQHRHRQHLGVHRQRQHDQRRRRHRNGLGLLRGSRGRHRPDGAEFTQAGTTGVGVGVAIGVADRLNQRPILQVPSASPPARSTSRSWPRRKAVSASQRPPASATAPRSARGRPHARHQRHRPEPRGLSRPERVAGPDRRHQRHLHLRGKRRQQRHGAAVR